ncbi:MAG: PASTA domain-containing protein, partial [Ktedonobacterales bacterium]
FTVTLTVSQGPKKIAIPGVSGIPYQQALQKLTQSGFTNVTTIQEQSSVQATYVIKTVPSEGNYALAGDPIKVYVSTGLPTATPSPTAPTATATPLPTCTAIQTPTPGLCI